jgi:hypothetical protein
MSELLTQCGGTIDLAVRGMLAGDRRLLERAHRSVSDLRESTARKELLFVRVLKRVRPDDGEPLLDHLETLACEQDMFQSVATIVDAARTHVLNAHERPSEDTAALLEQVNACQQDVVSHYAGAWRALQPPGPDGARVEDLIVLLERTTRSAVSDLYTNVRPVKNTTLVVTLLTEMADFAREMQRAERLWNSAFMALAAQREREEAAARGTGPAETPEPT